MLGGMSRSFSGITRFLFILFHFYSTIRPNIRHNTPPVALG